jgi:hypothetical protein
VGGGNQAPTGAAAKPPMCKLYTVLSSTLRRLAVIVMLIASSGVLAAPDVRILIDVSGSMRDNDPANLRVPAMRLISELLPPGTTAGVWLFAETATPLVAPGVVDAAWRTEARRQLPRIHARGLFTDIERALEAALGGWKGAGNPGERHVVLLTDGVVDVSKNPDDSAASRARILASQIEQLQARGATVHAIALSDMVDKALLEALTAGTGGWLERADDAASLQRIFLRMLEQTAPPVTVPLDGRRFDIDSTVTELTLLVFRGSDMPVTLTAPDGVTWRQDEHPAAVQWRHEAGYDLITVAQPQSGTWQFEGTEDPDNRAVIVTNLVLSLDRLSTTMLQSATASLNAQMLAGGAPVTRLELLELVAASYTLSGASGVATTHALILDRDHARFGGQLDGAAIEPGVYQLSVTIDAGTFKRQVTTHVRVAADPITVRYRVDPATKAAVDVEVTAAGELTVAASLQGFVSVTEPNGEVRAEVLPAPVDGVAKLRVAAMQAGDITLAPQLYVDTPDGNTLRMQPEPHSFDLAFLTPAETDSTHSTSLSWPLLAVWVGGGNALLALGLGLVWLSLGRWHGPVETVA